MSDEESFVILGTSPNSSLDIMSSLAIEDVSTTNEGVTDSQVLKTNAVTDSKLLKVNGVTDSQLTNSSSSNASHFSVIHNEGLPPTDNVNEVDSGLLADSMPNTMEKFLAEPLLNGSVTVASNPMKQSVVSNSSAEGNLAASFILGEVHSDVLKASVYSQFPSITSTSGASGEDVLKLQNMLSEYLELKKTLMNTNLIMKQLCEQTQNWKSQRQAIEDECKQEIAKLRNENLKLRRDLESKVEQMNINEEARRKDHEEFVQSLSEKSSQIQNMRVEIEQLQQHQLASYEYIPKNANEAAQSKESVEYVTSLEHQRVVKNFERQMSEIVAENLELKDIQSQYIDEINCLKVNLVSAEELQKKANVEIQLLKASDVEKSEMFSRFDCERKALRVDIDVLRHQVDIYSQDFKIEHEARENLANEKDQLLADLRELQKKNQELIQEAQKNYEEHSRQVMAATGAFPKTRTQAVSCSSPRSGGNPIYTPTNYNCPVCGTIFKTLTVLQNHVNQCLDGN